MGKKGQQIAQFKVVLSPTYTPDDIADKIHAMEMAHFSDVIEKAVSMN